MGAEGTMIGTGAQNTIDIETACQLPNTAADRCANLTVNDYSDWFLPSILELYAMYLNKATINATAANNGGANLIEGKYWSSSESYGWARTQDIGTSYSDDADKVMNYYPVRAVRAF